MCLYTSHHSFLNSMEDLPWSANSTPAQFHTFHFSVNSWAFVGLRCSCFEQSRCERLYLTVVLSLVTTLFSTQILNQCWTVTCLVSSKRRNLGHQDKQAFVFVVSSLCPPAEAGYTSPRGEQRGGRFQMWGLSSGSPDSHQRILSKPGEKARARRPPMGLLRPTEWLTSRAVQRLEEKQCSWMLYNDFSSVILHCCAVLEYCSNIGSV